MNEAQVRMLKMEPIRVRCRACNKEVRARAGKSVCCGCSNMTTIKGDVISAVDLSQVIMLNTYSVKEDWFTDTDRITFTGFFELIK